MLPAALTGSLYNMMKTQQLQMKWEKRQKNPNMPKGNEEDPQIARFKETAADMRKSNVMSSLDGKLKAGMRLSLEEMDYLKLNHPELYRKAVEVEQERANYKRELANCKTKEDVERLNTQRSQRFLSEAKAITGNPNIPQGKKLELLDQISRRMMGVRSEHTTFVSKPEYADLPREAELAEEKKRKKKEVPPKDEIPEIPNYPPQPEVPGLDGGESADNPDQPPQGDTPPIKVPEAGPSGATPGTGTPPTIEMPVQAVPPVSQAPATKPAPTGQRLSIHA